MHFVCDTMNAQLENVQAQSVDKYYHLIWIKDE